MPTVNNKLVENLTPLQAEIRGYLGHEDTSAYLQWINEDLEARHSDTIVYVNGVYRGVAKKNTPLHIIADKFKLFV